ncbi:MAG: DUF1838 family protein [Steroidobacteraceae bacterium]
MHEHDGKGVSRRELLATGAAATASAAAGLMLTAGASPVAASSKHRTALGLDTGAGNARLMTRIVANLDSSRAKHGWYRGRVMGVAPGAAARDLLGIMGMSSQRALPLPDRPGWMLLQREVGFFFDLATGKVVDRWTNPLNEETVDVLHIANPSVSRDIEPIERDARFYDDPARAAAAARPFLLPWQTAGDRLFVEQHGHYWARNPLDPAVWVRESSGPMLQVSDMLSYNVALSKALDPTLISLEHWGAWSHVRPWQPWMLMGAAPGHLLYNCFTGSADELDAIPADIVALTRERFPDFLTPPEKRTKAEPSVIRFMRERKPVPPRAPATTNEGAPSP